MLASNLGWLAGNVGVVYRFNGSSWLSQTSGTNRDLNDVAMYGASLGYAVGTYETVCKYNGTRWSRVHEGSVITGLKSVAVISPTDIWAVGGQGLAVRYNGSNLSYASTVRRTSRPPPRFAFSRRAIFFPASSAVKMYV